MAIEVTTYRLRGGQIQPRHTYVGCAPTSPTPDFYTQTFGAEKVITVIDDAKTLLLASTDFQGQKAPETDLGIEDPAYIATTYVSASYQGRALRTTDGELVYSATEERTSEFIDESQIGIA